MAAILLVDDARTVRLITGRVCKSMGFQVLEAENGAVALSVVREHPEVDVILLDWHMPEMDGLTFLRALRGDPTLTQPYVVMCTTQNEIADISAALESGANEYVMKPFTEEILREKLLEAAVVHH